MLSLFKEEVNRCPCSRLGVLLTTLPASPLLSSRGHISSQSWPKDPRDVGPWQQLQGCGVLLAPR